MGTAMKREKTQNRQDVNYTFFGAIDPKWF